MKVGTVPKVTVGVAALIALIFLGFVGVRQMNMPIVEERVYLSPWEDGTPRPQNNPEGLGCPKRILLKIQKTRDKSITKLPQKEMEPIDDFLRSIRSDTNMAQFATDAEIDLGGGSGLLCRYICAIRRRRSNC